MAATKVGFLGLGMMGTPMALNLCRKYRVVVWNRTESKYATLIAAGATVGKRPSDVVGQCDVIFMMLFDNTAIQQLIDNDPKFLQAMHGKTLVNTSSVTVDYSLSLARQVEEAGGRFVEMPVSGSKIPAEKGQLVGMMAGDAAAANSIRPILESLTSTAVYCGPLGAGLKAKYAANLFVTAMAAGLSESMNLARAQGVDLEAFAQVLNNGPMASPYSAMKITKILTADWSPQASVKDCFKSSELIRNAVEEAEIDAPILRACNDLYRNAIDAGLGEEDMMAVYKMPDQREQRQNK